MTKEEIIKALAEGKTVTHSYFTETEWMKEENGVYLFEDGVRCPKHLFWADRTHKGWSDGWDIFQPATGN